jgi:pimeloyl-ACP methyl ester carboxylesterase
MPRFAHTSLRRFAALTAPLALVAGLLAAAPASAVPTGGPLVPALTWTGCDDGFECATATVPLDYAKPHGRTISLALTRLPATDRAHRIGSLFLNPGGPGGSGADFVRYAREFYSAQLRARFDIVGFDPRFIGASRPLATCASDQEYLDLVGDLPVFPITRAEEDQAHRAWAQYTALCAQRAPYLAYASTANVARDLDLLRAAVGDRKLSYVGYSYGSILGQTYAALFPGRVRALTIDGVIDAQKWSTGTPAQSHRVPFTTRMKSALGSYATYEQFTRLCDQAGPTNCPLATGGRTRAKFDRLAEHLKTEPFPFPDGPVVDYALLVDATRGALYNVPDWPVLAGEIQDVYTAVFSAGLRNTAPAEAAAAPTASAKALVRRAEQVPRLATSAEPAAAPLDGYAGFLSVGCSDAVNPRSERAWAAAGAAQDRVAPYFGRNWTWIGEPCASWSLPSPGRYLGPYDRPTSSPLLVVGNLYDPATPYSEAQVVADTVPGARLLTVNGYGHTSLAAPSACATAVFDAYTISGRLPARGTVCGQDLAPFTAS